MKTVREGWEHYTTEVLSPEIDTISKNRSQMAFYGGVAWTLRRLVGPKAKLSVEDLEALIGEISEFSAKIKLRDFS